MKVKRLILSMMATVLLSTAFTSCSSDTDDDKEIKFSYTFEFSSAIINDKGYWKDVYDPQKGNFLILPSATFSHKATVTEYDGEKYYSYKGFCPTRVNDQADHSKENWIDYQWGAIAPTNNASYLIACWDVAEASTTDINSRSCAIGFGAEVRPEKMLITNTAWGYWAMKNGSAFSKAFGPDDWTKLIIHGVNPAGAETGEVTVWLARNGEIENKWVTVDVTGLGMCSAVYFTMESSDTGAYGMNNPAYFAIGGIGIVCKQSYAY